ncbi:metallophosphoesterase [Flavobacterium sp. xlx-214]|uniref:metallophosphoesterase n=1 Tax=unclassified Flavobacterium TaxID=196869 RepID=UPI0013CF7A17|nr:MULTISPECIES: metallophosphoesterase [unclassified Flavobacterium]MBA5791849.1 metallophosphoesterase [Flavobacterium sp. xlx-221]QMI83086.1 metallophosphoesterase [Flavobacterium sp. xlx-214]
MKLKLPIIKISFFTIITFTVVSCASYHEQMGKDFKSNMLSNENSGNLLHEIVVVGDAGNADEANGQKLLQTVSNYATDAKSKQTLLFIGDNIYPLGMPKVGEKDRSVAEAKLDAQIDVAKKVNGSTVFLAGNHDWYHGLDGLMEQKTYVESKLGKKSFMPKKYEAIDALEINDQLTIITIDSEWFIQNWDKHSNINEGSFIKSREDFFEEFRSLINKNQNKVTVVAIHHPMLTNGSHGGYFSARQHLFPYKNIPLPVLGTIGNYLRKTSGASPADMQHTYYRALVDRLKTLTKNQEQVIFVSGHEHNLQYIEDDGVKQLISGAGSKKEEARKVQASSYSLGDLGFATLKVYENNRVDLSIHKLNEAGEEVTFQKSVLMPYEYTKKFPEVTQTTTTASVYTQESVQKSKTYQFLFGKHYRSIYGTPVKAPVANLATLYGGLTPIISGGGNQSMSLRLEDTQGKQYVMRGLRKSSKQFLQSAIFKDTYVEDKLEDTYVLEFIDDYYTTSHPYTPFILGKLSDAVNLYHSNPKLFYVPKQNALGKYNEIYGNELYMIEERPHKSQKDLDSYGNGDDIISTQDLLVNLEKDEKYQVDAKMYLRARIFDFLIGDWDRHSDQWRWVEKKEGDKIMYQPIPRDRDQAFAKIDGNLLSLLNRLNPLRHMQTYKEKYGNPRWITKSAFPLDKVFLQNTSLTDWQNTAQEVVDGISDKAIEEAFNELPTEIKNQYTNDIIRVLKARRSKLVEFSGKYYNELFKYATVVGTNKKDSFVVKTTKEKVIVDHFRAKKSGDTLTTTYTYYPENTKEIWVYGLDDDDEIKVEGEKSPIKLKLIGGRNNDAYNVATHTATKIFDYKSKPNNFDDKGNASVVLKDQYALNQYDYRKAPLNIMALFPDAGYNRDNGLMLGLYGVYTVNKFNRNPYSQKHQLRVKYNFATSGVSAVYKGSFKDYSNTGYITVDALSTSSNFTKNFFGFDNLKEYDHEKFEENHYRVRTSQFEFKPSYEWKGRNGSSFLFGPTYESTKIEETNNRLIDEQLLTHLFDTYTRQHFVGGRLKYQFENYDNIQEPTVGLGFMVLYGARFFADDFDKSHQYLNSKLNFVVPISNNKKLTWSSTYLFEKIFGNDYHFYQAASIGSNNGLRGYRQQRFIGHTSFVASQDIRYKMKNITNGVIPLSYGLYVGYDAGRIWNKYNPTNQWYQSYGAGLWLNALESFTGHVGLFAGKEDQLVTFGIGFKF